MSRTNSLPSMTRGIFIMLCAAFITNRCAGQGIEDLPYGHDWLEQATRMPGEYFIAEKDKYVEEQQQPNYYEYGASEYFYDNEYLSRMIDNVATAKKEPELSSIPCQGGNPCPNSTDDNTQSTGQQDGNGTSSHIPPTEDVDEIESYLPDENTPCPGGPPCENSTEIQHEIVQYPRPPSQIDYSPKARFEEPPIDKSAPPKKAPCTGGSSCPSARISREEMERSVYDRVRNNILRQLNMKEPPNVSARKVDLSSPPIQRILRKHGIKDQRHLDEEFVKDEGGDDLTTKETVISPAKPQLIPGLSGMHFTFSEDDMTYSVKSAVLWLHIKGHPGRTANATLEFYRYQEARNGSLIAVKFNKKKIKVYPHGMWRKFMITHEVSRWFFNSTSNYGIDIRCPEFPDIISGVEGNTKKPALEVEVIHTLQSRRQKRSTSDDCDADSQNNSCCRHNLNVSFHALGWDFVIAPAEFQSYHCYGDCTFLNLEGNYQRVHFLSDKSPAKSCCSPTKMSPIKLLYFDHDENVIYSQVEDMVIDKCGCV